MNQNKKPRDPVERIKRSLTKNYCGLTIGFAVRREVRDVELFLAGVAVGIALHRVIMALVLKMNPDTMCAYCMWLGKQKDRHE